MKKPKGKELPYHTVREEKKISKRKGTNRRTNRNAFEFNHLRPTPVNPAIQSQDAGFVPSMKD